MSEFCSRSIYLGFFFSSLSLLFLSPPLSVSVSLSLSLSVSVCLSVCLPLSLSLSLAVQLMRPLAFPSAIVDSLKKVYSSGTQDSDGQKW